MDNFDVETLATTSSRFLGSLMKGWIVVLLNACKFGLSFVYKLSVSRSIISNHSEYIISQELSPSIKIWETSNCLILVVITKGKFH